MTIMDKNNNNVAVVVDDDDGAYIVRTASNSNYQKQPGD